jgi:hypothetical protein
VVLGAIPGSLYETVAEKVVLVDVLKLCFSLSVIIPSSVLHHQSVTIIIRVGYSRPVRCYSGLCTVANKHTNVITTIIVIEGKVG